MDARSRSLTWLVLLAVLFAGIAVAAVLPPWEGADETAHWSYIQELADTGRAPVPGQARIAADVDQYPGPRRYSDVPPFDRTGFPTYRSAHAARAPVRDSRPTRFQDGGTPNWEAQHPPLYYAILVPLYRAAHGLPFRDHLFALRLATWALAFAGVAIGALATAYAAPEWARTAAPLMAAWPFMVPQVFPTMARLGNDPLCLLEAGLVWLLVLRLSVRLDRWVSVVALGLVLGLGLLTKAFYVPITVGAAAYLVFLGWRERKLGTAISATLAVLVIAAAVGGWWYVAQYRFTHDLTGGADFVALKQQGGITAGLARNYSPFAAARGLAALAATFAWTGTWSLARPPELLILGPLVLVAVPLTLWLAGLRRQGPALAWAPVFLVAPMLAGLLYHVVAFVALTGRGASTPGYYLHDLAAPLAFAYALGWRRGVLGPLLWAYTGLFTAGVWLLEVSLYSGCAAKLGADPHFSFQGADCVVDGHQLAALAHPVIAAGAALACVILLGVGLVRSRGAWLARPSPRSETELAPL